MARFFFILRQPHVRHAGADGRHAARGCEQQQIAVKQRVLRADGDGRQRVVQRKDLIQLQLVAPALRGVRVIDAQLAQLPAEQLQRQQQRAAHIASFPTSVTRSGCVRFRCQRSRTENAAENAVFSTQAPLAATNCAAARQASSLRRRQQHTGRLGLEDLVQHGGNGKQAGEAGMRRTRNTSGENGRGTHPGQVPHPQQKPPFLSPMIIPPPDTDQAKPADVLHRRRGRKEAQGPAAIRAGGAGGRGPAEAAQRQRRAELRLMRLLKRVQDGERVLQRSAAGGRGWQRPLCRT